MNATTGQRPYEPTTRDGLRLLAGCLRDRPALAALAVLGGLVYQLALPWFIERAVDQGIVQEDHSALLRWALIIGGAGILAAVAEMVLGWYSTLPATTQGNRLYIALADRVSRLDARAVARYGEGDLGMRGTRDVDLVRGWLSGVASFLTGVTGFVVMIVAITRLDPLLALICLLCVPPLVWINTLVPEAVRRGQHRPLRRPRQPRRRRRGTALRQRRRPRPRRRTRPGPTPPRAQRHRHRG
ncbi:MULTISPECIES: ABC transporter transmembrane domain-containing protein [Streptomyces]|uniref:ABC transmembrane type-1 domain-containing protein n=1 Tax=Streptomyces rubiginosohelvolus TaxID=67362 RepID=A0ABQ3BGQ3_9ACTN|nr:MULTISPECIES: ABC transporter transmembrane domain-containing protein [Streptomyces]RUP66288.1 ABC transporter transmembrane region [Streptomyces sp. NP10]GGR97461.1 hypothetical protein GCM10010284_33140 [Streptomyces rubiginosohelvolus]GGZ44557.1 hypothetical protein GCM10010328_18570 [Streptomyces pluricolorescens]